MDQRLPEQLRMPLIVMDRGFIRARTDMRGNPMVDPPDKVPKLDLKQLPPQSSGDVVLDVPSTPVGPPSKAQRGDMTPRTEKFWHAVEVVRGGGQARSSRSSQGGIRDPEPWESWEENAAS